MANLNFVNTNLSKPKRPVLHRFREADNPDVPPPNRSWPNTSSSENIFFSFFSLGRLQYLFRSKYANWVVKWWTKLALEWKLCEMLLENIQTCYGARSCMIKKKWLHVRCTRVANTMWMCNYYNKLCLFHTKFHSKFRTTWQQTIYQ